MTIPFRRDLAFAYGAVAQVTPLIRRVVARNPSPFTFHGTGTYIVGRGDVAIIDPGPDNDAHTAALLDAVAGETVTHILVTHTHIDHSPATAAIKVATGAPSYGFGPHGTGPGGPDVEEGADFGFVPDHTLAHGDMVTSRDWSIEAVHTPGHTSNHLCFALAEENTLFSGDHVMGWSTTVVSPPDGDMAAYMASLRLLRGRGDTLYVPTHGPTIPDPGPFVDALIHHRQERESQILRCLADGIETIPDMVERLYADVDRRLHGAAGCSVLAHLIHLVETGRVQCDGIAGSSSAYRLLP